MTTKTVYFFSLLFSVIIGTRIHAQPGTNDPTFNTFDDGTHGNGDGALGLNGNVTVIQPDGKILVGGNINSFNGTPISKLTRLTPDGFLDPNFNLQGTGFAVANSSVLTIAVQADEKIVVGGSFTSFSGNSRNRLVRFHSDGSLDEDFDVGTGFNNHVWGVIVQSDGKIIVTGGFTFYNGTPIHRICRLNSDGTLDPSFNIANGFNGLIQKSKVLADGKIIVVGNFTTFNGISRNGIARLHANGTLDTDFNPGTGFTPINLDIGAIIALSIDIQLDGKYIIGGSFIAFNGVTRNCIARLNVNGSLDTSFNPGSGFNQTVNTCHIQPDGTIIIGGFFTEFNGIPKSKIAKLNANGSLDLSFNSNVANFNSTHRVESTSTQPDGKIIVIGGFSRINDARRINIGRLNADGSLDYSFLPKPGFGGPVLAQSIQNDGKIIAVGSFVSFNDVLRNCIARVNTNGSLDTSFDPGSGANGIVNATAIQADGKIIIGGAFTSFNGTPTSRITRLNANGSLDANFNMLGTGPDSTILAIHIQTDGKILIGGLFNNVNGTSRNYIARLNTDGSIDMSFDPGTGFNNTVYSIKTQTNGKVVVGGEFTNFNGTNRSRIARLDADGSLDTSFGFINVSIFSAGILWVGSIAIQTDGKILIGGNFTSVGNVTRNRIARLNADGTLDTDFNPGTGFNNRVADIAIQANGKIVLGGVFTTINGNPSSRLARLNPDGSQDATFVIGTGFNSTVNSVALQADGYIIAGGAFTTFNGVFRCAMARLIGDDVCETVEGTDFISACAAITWIDGNTYPTSNNTATHLLVGAAQNGCDSMVTLNFTLLQPASGVDQISSCTPITWIDGNTYNTSNNTATFLLEGAAQNGCDSLVTLNFTLWPCTQLQAGSCGATNVTPNQLLFATNVGAPAYRFRFTGANNGGSGWNNNAFVVDRPYRYVYFNHLVPGFQFGATYSVEVAVGDGAGNFGPYGSACNVTLVNQSAAPLTQIQSSQCGATVNGNTLIFANQIFDAQGYRFRITGANNGGAGWNNNEFILDRTVRNFYFSWLVPGATPGATFSVEVAYLQNDGVTYSSYGSACNITLTAPTTQIQASQCGITGLMPNTLVFANQVFDAQGYRFRVTGANNGGAGWNNNVIVFDRISRDFTFQWNVPGSLAGETYQIEVAYLQNDGVTYSAYGAVCNATLFGVPSMVINNENEIFMAEKSSDSYRIVEVAFGANASHNPFTSEFGIQVLNANDSEIINVTIYDMSGKLIERNAVNPMDIEAAKFGSNLASGMYMIEVRQGSNQAVIRQVKN